MQKIHFTFVSNRAASRRQALRTVAGVALMAALPLSAQARLALSTAINRTARFRALSQRMAKAYAQLFLGVLPDRAREVLTTARQLGMSLPSTAVAQELFNACVAHGGAGWDHSGMVRALEILANHEIGQ